MFLTLYKFVFFYLHQIEILLKQKLTCLMRTNLCEINNDSCSKDTAKKSITKQNRQDYVCLKEDQQEHCQENHQDVLG